MRRCLLFRVALIYSSSLLYVSPSFAAFSQDMVNFTENFLQQYRRPFTILEICGNSEIYSLNIAKNKRYDVVSVVVLLESLPKKLVEIERAKLSNVIILRPEKLTRDMLKNLARCEQPDVVLVHDLPAYAKSLNVTRNSIELFLGLGDYLFFDGGRSDEHLLTIPQNKSLLIKTVKNPTNFGQFLAVFKTNKKGLMVPRWSMSNNFDSSTIYYQVISDFKQKKMYKTALRESTVWQKGINLLTFVMMKGVYPSHYHIREQIKKLSSLKHNDLVIGNLLIQGHSIKPIDFNDKRRSIDTERCIEALLSAFQYSSNIFKDPAQFYDYYGKKLKGGPEE